MRPWDLTSIPSRLSVADLLMRDDLAGEPLEAFEELLQEVRRSRDAEQISLVAERILGLDSSHLPAHAALVDAKLTLASAEDAIPYLEAALILLPDEITLRRLLIRVHESLEEPTRARNLRREIHFHHQSRGEHLQARALLAEIESTDEGGTSPSITLREIVSDPSSAPSLLLTEILAEPDTCPSFAC